MNQATCKRDPITVSRILQIHPKLRSELTEIYTQICMALTGRAFCRFAYVLRTFDEQNKLYAQGRTMPGKVVTNAKAGQSYHNYGLAVDIVLIIDGKEASWSTTEDFDRDGIADWMEIVKIFKQYGWEWGGDWHFKDLPHFQKTLGKSIAELTKLHSTGRVDENKYVLI